MKMNLLFLFLTFHIVIPIVLGELQVDFYKTSCPKAESIIKEVVQSRVTKQESSIAAAFLRMYFHDCFVTGCDASILIDSSHAQASEKHAQANLSVRGYKIIDEAKEKIEKECPGVVSCADIIAIATRDSVVLQGGPDYPVPTGRRDGTVSKAEDVKLPGPGITVPDLQKLFTDKGFTLEEMVVLLGAHTVGVAHCSFFRSRVFDFKGTKAADPSMDPALVEKLKKVCPDEKSTEERLKTQPSAMLDQNTSYVVDNEYYNQIIKKMGVLQIDQELASDESTASLVADLGKDAAGFKEKFAAALVKMGNVEVLEGDKGEIRKKCRLQNSRA